MNNSNIELKNELLKDYPELKSSFLYERSPEFIKEVLNMKEWKEPQFQGLLTSNIWHSKINTIKSILNSEILKDERYKHLLIPSIFNVSLENVFNDYFDLFTIEYEEFIKKIDKLNIKYNSNYFLLVENDLNYLEEMFLDI